MSDSPSRLWASRVEVSEPSPRQSPRFLLWIWHSVLNEDPVAEEQGEIRCTPAHGRREELWAGAEARAVGRGGVARVHGDDRILVRHRARQALPSVKRYGQPPRAPGDRLRHSNGGQEPMWSATREYWLPWMATWTRSHVAVRRVLCAGPAPERTRSSGERAQRESPAALDGPEPIGKPQEAGGAAASGRARTVGAHLPDSAGAPRLGPAGLCGGIHDGLMW